MLYKGILVYFIAITRGLTILCQRHTILKVNMAMIVHGCSHAFRSQRLLAAASAAAYVLLSLYLVWETPTLSEYEPVSPQLTRKSRDKCKRKLSHTVRPQSYNNVLVLYQMQGEVYKRSHTN